MPFLPLSQYNDVAKFMVENYYLDGNSGLPGTARRRLEGDQLYDLRERYMSKGNRDAAVIVADSDGEIGETTHSPITAAAVHLSPIAPICE